MKVWGSGCSLVYLGAGIEVGTCYKYIYIYIYVYIYKDPPPGSNRLPTYYVMWFASMGTHICIGALAMSPLLEILLRLPKKRGGPNKSSTISKDLLERVALLSWVR